MLKEKTANKAELSKGEVKIKVYPMVWYNNHPDHGKELDHAAGGG